MIDATVNFSEITALLVGNGIFLFIAKTDIQKPYGLTKLNVGLRLVSRTFYSEFKA